MSEVEFHVGRLLAQMLGANVRPVVALYLTLQNERSKSDAIKSVATHSLDVEQLELFNAIMRTKTSIAKQRHDLAHGIFCLLADADEAIGWISSSDRTKHHLGFEEARKAQDFSKMVSDNVRELMFVYTKPDLEVLFSEIEGLVVVLQQFVKIIQPETTNVVRTKLRHQLLSNALVQRSLSQPGPDD